jgi:propionate catabolism operon transcriptional regulator
MLRIDDLDGPQARRMTQRPARIWVVSKGMMSQRMHRLEPEYRGQAQIGFIDETFEAALPRVRELEAAGAVDVIVTAGANGAYLRRLIRSPIAMVRVSGIDMLEAIARARAIGGRAVLMTHEELGPLIDASDPGDPALVTRRYTQPADALATMQSLSAEGYRVFIGPSLIVSLAEQLGAAGVFVYSERSLRQALDDAIDLTALAFEEQVRRRQLETVLEGIDHGVVGVDLRGVVRSMNRRMAEITGVSREWALGKPLRDVVPALGLESTLRTGRAQSNVTERLGSRTVIVNRVPVLVDHQVTGAVLTCQEAGAVRRAEELIRRSSRPASTRARDRRRISGWKTPARAGTFMGSVGCDAADYRRERHRQGDAGPGHSSSQPATERSLRRDQLRGHPRHADRKRALRPRRRRVHRRPSWRPAGTDRNGSPGHALPG